MRKYDKIISKIVKFANLKYPDAEIYLYGSRARSDSKGNSDWDLLILLNVKKVSFEMETGLIDDFYELDLETGEVISLLIYSKSEWINKYSISPLFENINKEGIRLK